MTGASSSSSETSYSTHSSNASSSPPPPPTPSQPYTVHIAVEVRGDEGVGVCIIRQQNSPSGYYTFGINQIGVDSNEEDSDNRRAVRNCMNVIKDFKSCMTQDSKVFIHSTADFTTENSNYDTQLHNQLRQLKERRGLRSLEISSCQNVHNRYETRAAFALLDGDLNECERILETHPISARRAD
jgi:hypothetical protein